MDFSDLKPIDSGGEIEEQIFCQLDYNNDEAVKTCEQLVKVADAINALMNKFGFPIYVDASYYKDVVRSCKPSADLKQTLIPVLSGEYIGPPPLSAICTAMVALYKYFVYYRHEREGRCRCKKSWSTCGVCGEHQYLQGNCQCGKTLVLGILFWIIPVMQKLLRGTTNYPVVSVPNNINIHSSAYEEIELILRLFSNFIVKRSDLGTMVPGDWTRTIIQKVPGFITQDMIKKRNHPEFKKLYDRLLELKQKSSQGYMELTLFTDETHNGSAFDGVQDVFNRTCKNLDVPIREIGITATGSEFQSAPGWDITPVYMGDGYMGITTYNGKTSPVLPGATIREQDFRIIEDEYPSMRIYLCELPSGLTLYDCLDKAKSYYKFWKIQNDHNGSYDSLEDDDKDALEIERRNWIRRMARDLVKIWKDLLTKEFPAGFIRPFKNVANCEIFYEAMEQAAKDDFHLLRFFGSPLPPEFGKPAKPLKKVMLYNYVLPGKKVLVVASSGRSVMGDSYHKSTRCFMDLFESQYTYNTMVQGTVGRSQGYNKQSIVLLREKYHNEITMYKEQGFPPDASNKNFGPRDLIKSKVGRKSKSAIIMPSSILKQGSYSQ